MPLLRSRAPAKINLTLRVIRQRPDGYHDIVSLVAFADVGDDLTLVPGGKLDLDLVGPNAGALGDVADNLVLIAAQALDRRIKKLVLGQFKLMKNLPVGAGLGGGSADAAAALRLLAIANDLKLDDPRVFETTQIIGADVPVCLRSKARVMSGIGDRLSAPMRLPPLPAVIVFPGAHVATEQAFAMLDQMGVESLRRKLDDHPEVEGIPLERHEFIAFLNTQANDLARATESFLPIVVTVEERLRRTSGVQVVRMSGSGSSVFGIYESQPLAAKAAEEIRAEHPNWWVQETNFV
jgi:4-diphosphocytidyl-2-C-methyl-D-erythritol kinase